MNGSESDIQQIVGLQPKEQPAKMSDDLIGKNLTSQTSMVSLEKNSCSQPPLVSTNPPQDSTQSVSSSPPLVLSRTWSVSDNPPSVSISPPLVSESQPLVPESQPLVSCSPLIVSDSTSFVFDSPSLVSSRTCLVSESNPLVSRSPPSVSSNPPLVSDSTPSVSDCTPLVSSSPSIVSSSLPLAETNISLNGCRTKDISNGPHKVFYSSLVEALTANKNVKPATNEYCIDTDLMSEEEMTTKPTNSKATYKSKKISRTQKNKISSEVKIPKPILNSEKIISEIIASCDRHVSGQTSSIQIILNICSQIMPIEGCEKHGNDIMDVCSQILSDAYRNSQNIIELCKRLSKWQAKIEMNQETTSKVKVPKKKTRKKKKIMGKSKPLVQVKIKKEVEDVHLVESPPESDSEVELNQVDDPEWTAYWEKKNSSAISQVNADVSLSEGDRGLRKKRKISEDDTDWLTELDQEMQSKSSKKDEKPVRKRPPPIRGEFKCYQCPRIFPTLKGFQNHLECHKKVTCELCNLVCTKPHLKRHMMVHTGEKPFICDVCGSGFADVSSMKDHQHVHTDVKKIQCELCDYRCKTVKRLRMHMVRHTTERRFQCDNCGARFLRNSDLKKHLIVHKDTYPFACGNCPKRFKDKMHLKRHEETHTDQYKFQCPFCGKRMRQSGNLKTHMRTHNGEKPYKCEKCGQGFAHNVTKKQHQEQCRRVHGVEVLIP